MALGNLVPRNGAFTYAGYAVDFQTQSIMGQQVTDDVTPYGANIYSARNIGSGTPNFTANITGFAKQGAANTAPNFAGANSVYSSGGAATVMTFDSGCTESFTGIVEQFTLSQSRIRGATPVTLRLRNSAELTEAWQVT